MDNPQTWAGKGLFDFNVCPGELKKLSVRGDGSFPEGQEWPGYLIGQWKNPRRKKQHSTPWSRSEGSCGATRGGSWPCGGWSLRRWLPD